MRYLPRTLVAGLAAAAVALPAWAATAAPPSPRLRFVDFSHRGPDGEEDPGWWLTVDAWDPDGVVWTVEVDFGDHSMTSATTYCVEADKPGSHAVMRIPHEYEHPGTYEVRAQVSSYPRCPTAGSHHRLERSDWQHAKVLVDEPAEGHGERPH